MYLLFSGITSFFDSKGNIRDFSKIRISILNVLIGVGMTPSLPKIAQAGPPEVLSVLLDGRVVGSIPSAEVEKAVSYLRRLKLSTTSGVRVSSNLSAFVVSNCPTSLLHFFFLVLIVT